MSGRVIIMREATTRIVKMLGEKDVRVTQRGAKAFVQYDAKGKPTRVNIPYIPDDATEELMDAIQGFIDHEVAHILFTDYRVLGKAKMLKLSYFHNIIEDSFIERKMAEHFAGSGLNLRNVGQFYLNKCVIPELEKFPESAEGLLFIPAVRAWAGQTAFSDFMDGKWHLIQEITDILGESVKDIALCKTSEDCLTLAGKFRDMLEAARPKPPAAPPPPKKEEPEEGEPEMRPEEKFDPTDKESEGGPEDDDDDAPPPEPEEPGAEGEPESEEPAEAVVAEPTEEPIPEPVAEEPTEEEEEEAPAEEPTEEESGTPAGGPKEHAEEEESEEASAGASGDDDEDGAHSTPKPTDEPTPEEPAVEEPPEEEEPGPSKLEELEKMMPKDFDEALSEEITALAVEGSKDSEYLVYTTELDVTEPMEIGRGRWDESYLKELTDTVDHMVGPLQKDLERAVAAHSASTWSPGHRSGRLNASVLSRLTAFGDDRVFRRKQINNSKDVAVELLVDCSGSMGMEGKIRTAAYSAYGLSSVLDRMMIPNEVMGFTTLEEFPAEMKAEQTRLGVRYARHQTLYHPIMKAFNERMTSDVKRRFAALPRVQWLRENVDGESLQVAAHRLAQRRETRKILMVLSDGNPACPGDTGAQRRHLKKTAGQIERSGIDLIAIGINDDAPKHFYKKFLLIRDVSELPTTVIGEIKRLLMK